WRLDDKERSCEVEQIQWPHSISFSRPRCASGHGARSAWHLRAISRTDRWTAPGRSEWHRRGRTGQWYGCRAAAISADPAAEAHRRSTVRDRVSRSRRGSIRLHLRLIRGSIYGTHVRLSATVLAWDPQSAQHVCVFAQPRPCAEHLTDALAVRQGTNLPDS